MPFSRLVMTYLLTMIVFCVLDIAWVGFIAKGIYRKYLGDYLGDTINWPAIIVFYLLFLIGLFVFTIMPAVEANHIGKAIWLGALFGAIAYATYDLTNLGTMKNWPWIISVIDIAWGAVITATVSAAGFYITRWIS